MLLKIIDDTCDGDVIVAPTEEDAKCIARKVTSRRPDIYVNVETATNKEKVA